MNLEINVIDEGQKLIIKLAGEIDIYTAPKLKEALVPHTREENNVLIVDLTEVNYMDSTGLGVFISVLKSTRENGSSFQIVNLQERVLRLFTITGLDEIMDINSTETRREVENENGAV